MESRAKVIEAVRSSGLTEDAEHVFGVAGVLTTFFQMNGLDPIEALLAIEFYRSTVSAGITLETGEEQQAKVKAWKEFLPKLQGLLDEFMAEAVALRRARSQHVGEVGRA